MQAELIQAAVATGIPAKKMIRPVDTRWNTMCEVIERALELRPALDRLLSQPKYTKGKTNLSKLKLTGTEWNLLVLLKPTLKVSEELSSHRLT